MHFSKIAREMRQVIEAHPVGDIGNGGIGGPEILCSLFHPEIADELAGRVVSKRRCLSVQVFAAHVCFLRKSLYTEPGVSMMRFQDGFELLNKLLLGFKIGGTGSVGMNHPMAVEALKLPAQVDQVLAAHQHFPGMKGFGHVVVGTGFQALEPRLPF